jgi:hypothetical protein
LTAAAALSLAFAGGDADTELVELANQLAPLHDEFMLVEAEHRRLGSRAHEIAEARAAAHPKRDCPESMRTDRFIQELGPAGDETGFNEIERRWHELSRVIQPLADRIVRIQAQTPKGLLGHAMLALQAKSYLWDGPADEIDDYYDRVMRSVLESLCVVTGLAIPVEATPADDEPIDDTPAKPPIVSTDGESSVHWDTPELAYAEWLFNERRLLMRELFPGMKFMDRFVPWTRASCFHFPSEGKNWDELPQPSSRAHLVMRTVGVDMTIFPEAASITAYNQED